jgi:hypothetical protein
MRVCCLWRSIYRIASGYAQLHTHTTPIALPVDRHELAWRPYTEQPNHVGQFGKHDRNTPFAQTQDPALTRKTNLCICDRTAAQGIVHWQSYL